jgi:hypothetical protein
MRRIQIIDLIAIKSTGKAKVVLTAQLTPNHCGLKIFDV